MQLQMIQFITLFLLLLVTGVFWGPWLALHRSLHLFTKEEFIKITKLLGANLGRPMQILMPLCLLCMILSIAIYPHKSSLEFYIMLTSFLFFLITLTVTLTTELPIVNKVKEWSVGTVPSNWEEIRNKWMRFHTFRVFPALISFGLYLAPTLNHF